MKTRSTQKKRYSPAPPARPHADPHRCRFTRTDGRRCQMSRTAKHATLCLFHAKQDQEFAQAEQDLSQELVSLSGNLKTASDVNHVLRKLFSLLAQRRISRRDAVALAYIAQLILQTLPGVKRETQQVLGDDAWQETLEAGLGLAEHDEAENEDEENESEDEGEESETEEDEGESVDEESPGSQAEEDSADQDEGSRRVPANLTELAAMILSRHNRSHAALPSREPPT